MATSEALVPAACGCPARRRTVTDYVLNPCRKSAGPLDGPAGEVVAGADGASVRFQALVEDGRVLDARYQATSCATLVAYAEVLAEIVTGREVAKAMTLTPSELVASLPGVPAHRHDRAALVVRAWWSAIAHALQTANEINEGDCE